MPMTNEQLERELNKLNAELQTVKQQVVSASSRIIAYGTIDDSKPTGHPEFHHSVSFGGTTISVVRDHPGQFNFVVTPALPSTPVVLATSKGVAGSEGVLTPVYARHVSPNNFIVLGLTAAGNLANTSFDYVVLRS